MGGDTLVALFLKHNRVIAIEVWADVGLRSGQTLTRVAPQLRGELFLFEEHIIETEYVSMSCNSQNRKFALAL